MTPMKVMNELDVLKAALAVGWVKFTYRKLDGSVRTAIGTHNPTLISTILGDEPQNRGHNKHHSDSTTPYFDLTRNAFRMFCNCNFMHIEFENIDNFSAISYAIAINKAERVSDYALGIMADKWETILERDTIDKIIGYVDTEMEENCDKIVMKLNNENFHEVRGGCDSGRSLKCVDKQSLIRELMEIRKRESEILAQLFGM